MGHVGVLHGVHFIRCRAVRTRPANRSASGCPVSMLRRPHSGACKYAGPTQSDPKPPTRLHSGSFFGGLLQPCTADTVTLQAPPPATTALAASRLCSGGSFPNTW
ncbi:hypothetical protein NDU88_003441 [Pleurodeles waltl]|uniref:Uncharacterized protein n=1 Tax=Pleurodeles waltl TaxID=8319 RepID=A0AAV7M3E1_PLEWA|nr:hypothetical protein NDU88_003441 [Pleurodeles waltl]